MKQTDLERLRALIEPLAESLGLILWGLEIAPGPGRAVLRIYVDTPEGAAEAAAAIEADAAHGPKAATPHGVSIDQCARLSRHLSVILDAEDVMPGAYALEVSSPGLDRPFFTPEQAAPYVGQILEIKLLEPRDGRKNFKGELKAVAGSVLTLDVEGHEESFDWPAVKKARLVYDFNRDLNRK